MSTKKTIDTNNSSAKKQDIKSMSDGNSNTSKHTGMIRFKLKTRDGSGISFFDFTECLNILQEIVAISILIANESEAPVPVNSKNIKNIIDDFDTRKSVIIKTIHQGCIELVLDISANIITIVSGLMIISSKISEMIQKETDNNSYIIKEVDEIFSEETETFDAVSNNHIMYLQNGAGFKFEATSQKKYKVNRKKMNKAMTEIISQQPKVIKRSMDNPSSKKTISNKIFKLLKYFILK